MRAQSALVLLLILSAGFGWFVLKYGPYSAYSHYRRANGWFEKEEYAKAVGEYSEAIRLDPKLADAYEGRGNAWLAKKDSDKAIADHNEAVRLDPRSARVYYDRAGSWSEKKEYDKAIADYTEAIHLDPDFMYSYSGRAAVWNQKGEYDRAIADYTEAIRRESLIVYGPDDKPESTDLDDSLSVFKTILAYSYQGRGAAWLGKQEYDKALADYNVVLRLQPRVSAGYYSRGTAWELKGEYIKAIADYEEAIRLDAKMSFAYDRCAWVWATCPDPTLRDGKKAVESAMKACELAKWNEPHFLPTLAAAYAEAHDFDSAVQWQTKALASITNPSENQEQRARLLLYQDKKPYRMPKP